MKVRPVSGTDPGCPEVPQGPSLSYRMHPDLGVCAYAGRGNSSRLGHLQPRSRSSGRQYGDADMDTPTLREAAAV